MDVDVAVRGAVYVDVVVVVRDGATLYVELVPYDWVAGVPYVVRTGAL